MYAGSFSQTREEFTGLVLGKTPDEVLGVLGKPDSTSNNAWYYSGKTKGYDQRHKRFEGATLVQQRCGRVRELLSILIVSF